jgi:YfiH family protein
VGDRVENVRENRRRAFLALARVPESIHDVWQVHADSVVVAEGPRGGQTPRQADGLITDNPAVTLFMRFADCVPIFLHDPQAGAIGLVHAGWRGTLEGVVEAAVGGMKDNYGSDPGDIIAGIGPAICVHCYPVGEEVAHAVRVGFGEQAERVRLCGANGVHLDLWEASRILLERAGVRQVEVAGLCTAMNTQDWYSHRAEGGRTGRFGALLALRN